MKSEFDQLVDELHDFIEAKRAVPSSQMQKASIGLAAPAKKPAIHWDLNALSAYMAEQRAKLSLSASAPKPSTQDLQKALRQKFDEATAALREAARNGTMTAVQVAAGEARLHRLNASLKHR